MRTAIRVPQRTLPLMPAKAQLGVLGSDLERAFDTHWRQAAAAIGVLAPELTPQHPFHGFALDRAHLEAKVAIEIDGGTQGAPVICHQCGTRVRARKRDGQVGKELRLGGGHSRGEGSDRDRRKSNLLMVEGWLLFRLTSTMLRDDPILHIVPIIETIRQRLVV